MALSKKNYRPFNNEMVKQMSRKWELLTSILRKAANECLGTRHKWKRKSGVRNWDDELAQIIEDKRAAFRTFISTRKQED
jgi:hypothetical protein